MNKLYETEIFIELEMKARAFKELMSLKFFWQFRVYLDKHSSQIQSLSNFAASLLFFLGQNHKTFAALVYK